MSEVDYNRYKQVLKLVSNYAHQYYALDAPSVSDAVYDNLMMEIKNFEQNHPDQISPNSPTQRIGAKPLAKFQKVTLQHRMLSLEDVFSYEEIKKWKERISKLADLSSVQYFTDLKMDGMACVLVYQDGELQQAITRGDGRVGEDVTQNVRTITNIPLLLEENTVTSGRLEVRGEIIMLKSDFEKVNKQRQEKGEPLYANPRNLTAGTIRQLDSELVAKRPLRFHAYDIIPENESLISTNSSAYDILAGLKFTVNIGYGLFDNFEDLFDYLKQWESKRSQLPFNTDGVVIKVNDKKTYQNLGVVGKNPRGALAFKYPAEEATTILKDIVISLGRTGAATPVAVFDPVVVAGTTVKHASLHNADEIARKDIRIGDTVVIYKAGDIIPQVMNVIEQLRPKNSKAFNFEQELKRQYPELEFARSDNEAVYRVKGTSAPMLLKRAVEHYASRGALNIEGLGEKNAEVLVDEGLLKDLADIYSLTVFQLLKLDRFAELSANNLINAINATKEPQLHKFIYGLGIRHVGAQTAIDLANYYKSLEKLKNASLDSLQSIDGVGEVVAESIVAWFADDDNLKTLNKFIELGVNPVYADLSQGKLHGKSFVITGTLSSLSRDQASERIQQLGGTFQTSVGVGTKYLVAGGKIGASKLSKAQKYGTTILTEEEFLQMLSS